MATEAHPTKADGVEIPSNNVFISWSGDESKAYAKELHQGVKIVIHNCRPFMSTEDIAPGKIGINELGKQLESIKFGIICLTSENHASPWVNFEAGALAKQLSDPATSVIPLRFGVTNTQITGPLSSFQSRAATEAELLSVFQVIAKAVRSPLTPQDIEVGFRLWWNSFSTKMENIAKRFKAEEEAPARSSNDMLEELIDLSRTHAERLRFVQSGVGGILRQIRAHLDLMNSALRRLADLYTFEPRRLTADELATTLGDRLDDEDWTIIRSSPFLTWYLSSQYSLEGPSSRPDDDMDDVPF